MESGTMANEEEYSTDNLQRCSYRFLQQTAKALKLPSNVKKVYLIQLIFTQKHCSQEELDILVRQVRQERQQLALLRKKALRKKKLVQHQSSEISSTSNSKSPPITNTPKRVSHILIRYSPEMHSPVKYTKTVPARTCPVSSSDRVLRSFNRVKKPSYLLNNTTLLGLIKATGSEERSETTTVNIVKEEKYRKFNRTYVRKSAESWRNGGELRKNAESWRNGGELRKNADCWKNAEELRKSADSWRNGRELVPVPRSVNIPTPTVARRERRLSGIYPLNLEATKQPIVAVRRADGTLSKLNAIIQNPQPQHNYNYERESTSNRNRSLLSIEGAERPHTAPNINISEIAHSFGYRAPNMPPIAPNIDYKAPNMLDFQPNMGYRTQNRSEIEQQNMDYRTSNVSEITANYSYGAPNYSYVVPNVAITDPSQNNFNYSSSSEEMNISSTYKENHDNDYAVYYHKKIRAEQVRSLRSREPARPVDNECSLPTISEVFSKFNSVYCRDVTQPVYVQVDGEPEMSSNPSYIPDPHIQYQDSNMLEKLYNLKSVMINQQPLLQVVTTTNTRTVYSTPIISTAKAQPSSTAAHSVINMASSSRDSQPYFTDDEIPRVHDFFRNFRCDEEAINDASTLDFTRSSSSAETVNSQELGANVTIPEMVEDALELISQDGDYMERMGMDIRMQCILCNWAGPKIILEYHIRKEHSGEIIQCASGEWCCSYTLGALASRRLWRSQLLEHRAALYVLSAKYEDPDCFMAALSTLSSDPDTPVSGNMTIYNKVTGEPYIWQGEIPQLPPSMPYDNDPNCLKLELSRMNLLPNSANLKLLNRELVIHSPTKVVVGQPELDNINICLTVKIFG